MATAQQDIVVPQGSTFRLVIDVLGGPASLAGYTGKMQMRELKSDPLPLATVDSSDITVDLENRQVVVEVPGTVTAQYDWTRGVYDLVIDGPQGPWRLAEGRVRVSRSVTRED